LAGLKKYVEWMSRGRNTDRVVYVMDEWDLPEPIPGAHWAADKTFNAAQEVLRDPTLKDVFRSAINNGVVIVTQKSAT